MDWSEERYARLYTRDTAEWLSLAWQARALFPLLVRKADRTGAIALGKIGRKGLTTLVGLPLEVVNSGMDGDEGRPGLLEDGCVEDHATYIIMPNFIEAQEAVATPSERQRKFREKRRDNLLKKHDSVSRGVTRRNALSRGVTRRNALSRVSQKVTPSLTVPNRTEPNQREAHVQIERLRSLWNEITGPHGLPAWYADAEARKPAAAARLKKYPDLNYWRSVIERIVASSFCRGGGKDGWVASPDFLVQPGAAVKVLEGKYDDRPAVSRRASDIATTFVEAPQPQCPKGPSCTLGWGHGGECED